jgi:hypothetical protein
MLGRPSLGARRDQDDRLRASFQPFLERLVPAFGIGPDDERLGLAVPGLQEIEQTLADRVGISAIFPGHDDDENLAIGDRIAERRGVERMNPVVAVGHFGQRSIVSREGFHAKLARSPNQASTASL